GTARSPGPISTSPSTSPRAASRFSPPARAMRSGVRAILGLDLHRRMADPEAEREQPLDLRERPGVIGARTDLRVQRDEGLPGREAPGVHVVYVADLGDSAG